MQISCHLPLKGITTQQLQKNLRDCYKSVTSTLWKLPVWPQQITELLKGVISSPSNLCIVLSDLKSLLILNIIFPTFLLFLQAIMWTPDSAVHYGTFSFSSSCQYISLSALFFSTTHSSDWWDGHGFLSGEKQLPYQLKIVKWVQYREKMDRPTGQYDADDGLCIACVCLCESW